MVYLCNYFAAVICLCYEIFTICVTFLIMASMQRQAERKLFKMLLKNESVIT